MVISDKSLDPCSVSFVARILPPHVSWVHYFSEPCFDVAPGLFVNFKSKVLHVQEHELFQIFLWLILGSKSDLTALNAILTVVKIFLHVILILPAAPRTAWSKSATCVFHRLGFLLFCASYYFHLPAIIVSVFVTTSLFFLSCSHCSCRWL